MKFNSVRLLSSRFRDLLHIITKAISLFVARADHYSISFALIAVFSVVISTVFMGLAPVALQMLVDHLSVDPDTEKQSRDGTVTLVILLLLCYGANRFFMEVRDYFQGLSEQRLTRRLGKHIFKHLLSLPLQFHIENKAGAINQTMINGLTGFGIIFKHLLSSIFPVMLELSIIVLVLMSLGHFQYLAIVVVAAIAYFVVFGVAGLIIVTPVKAISNAQIHANGLFVDAVTNHECVKLYTAEQQLTNRYDSALTRTESMWRLFYDRKCLSGFLIGAVFLVSVSGTVALAAAQVEQGVLTLGGFVLVLTYLLRIIQPIEALGFAFRDILYGGAFVDKLTEIIDEEPELNRSLNALDLDETGIVFDRVSYSYHAERPLLTDLSFSIMPGETIAIVGSSGSGKSTIARLATRLLQPVSGQIRIGGIPICDLPLSLLRNQISVVPQNTAVFHESVYFNISLGQEQAHIEDVLRVARLSQLDDAINMLPEGYDTLLGDSGSRLSGGEKQRVAIARALLREPRFYIFDEITSALDVTTETQIMKNIERELASACVLIIAHRLATIKAADRILVLRDGAIAEAGSHDELIRSNGLYASLWRTQSEGNLGQ